MNNARKAHLIKSITRKWAISRIDSDSRVTVYRHGLAINGEPRILETCFPYSMAIKYLIR